MKQSITIILFVFSSFRSYSQAAQFTNVGIGVAPLAPNTTLLNLKRGWGNFIQFNNQSNNGYYGLVNHQYEDMMSFYYRDPQGNYIFDMLVFQNDGKVRIGNNINTPGSYKLYVEEGILTEKVRVAVKGTTSWADHVFAPGYKLLPLKELQTYISENKHLPEIPSAQEVVKDGVDLGQMDAKLLQKIEELTLYVIQQQKEIEELKKKVGK